MNDLTEIQSDLNQLRASLEQRQSAFASDLKQIDSHVAALLSQVKAFRSAFLKQKKMLDDTKNV